jgi:DNA cross-link repair 1B protein
MFSFDLVHVGFQVIDIISSHPDHDVIIGINNYGKEDLLLQISRALDIEVFNFSSEQKYIHHASMLYLRRMVNRYLCH